MSNLGVSILNPPQHTVRLSDAVAVNALKEHIISQAQALYGSEGHSISVLLYQTGQDCIAKLIAFEGTEPYLFSKFKVLAEYRDKWSRLHETKIKQALEGLGEKVHKEICAKIPDLAVGQTWDGLPVYDARGPPGDHPPGYEA